MDFWRWRSPGCPHFTNENTGPRKAIWLRSQSQSVASSEQNTHLPTFPVCTFPAPQMLSWLMLLKGTSSQNPEGYYCHFISGFIGFNMYAIYWFGNNYKRKMKIRPGGITQCIRHKITVKNSSHFTWFSVVRHDTNSQIHKWRWVGPSFSNEMHLAEAPMIQQPFLQLDGTYGWLLKLLKNKLFI